MPFIRTSVNQPLPAEKQQMLKQELIRYVVEMGKREKFLMLEFCENRSLFFAGTDEACAMVEMNLYLGAEREAYGRFTAQVCTLLEEQLGIPPERVFVNYCEYQHWGTNGANFG